MPTVKMLEENSNIVAQSSEVKSPPTKRKKYVYMASLREDCGTDMWTIRYARCGSIADAVRKINTLIGHDVVASHHIKSFGCSLEDSHPKAQSRTRRRGHRKARTRGISGPSWSLRNFFFSLVIYVQSSTRRQTSADDS